MKTKTTYNKQITILGTVLLLLLAVSPVLVTVGCSGSQEKKQEEKKKKKDDAKKLKIALIPFDSSFVIGAAKSKEAYNKFGELLLKNKSFHPSSMNKWMTENFMNVITRKSLDYTKPPEIAKYPRARNIKDIIALAKKKGLKIDLICHGKIFKSGKKIGIIISVYSLKAEIPHYFYRSFLNFNQIDFILKDIIKEMGTRFKMRNKPVFNRHMFVKNFRIKFYTYTRLKSGEESIINLPYININGISYKENDKFFQEIFLYNLHVMRVFHVWNSNMRQFIVKRPSIPPSMRYILDVSIDISGTTSLLTAIIHDKTTGKKVNFRLPFESLELDNLFYTMRLFAMNVMMHALTNDENRKVGVLDINAVDANKKVFIDNYYIGTGVQKNLLLPAGAVNIYIDKEKYRTFISPFMLNNRIYNLKRSFILKYNK